MEDNERIFPDDKLVSMFRNGDSHAFEILLSRYDECIMRAIRKSTINNNDSVEDLYQEIVTHLYEKLTYIIHSGFISGYQNRYGDNLKPPTNVYHRMTA